MIEAFIQSKVLAIQNAIEEKKGHVPSKNKLTHSYFYPFVYHHLVGHRKGLPESAIKSK